MENKASTYVKGLISANVNEETCLHAYTSTYIYIYKYKCIYIDSGCQSNTNANACSKYCLYSESDVTMNMCIYIYKVGCSNTQYLHQGWIGLRYFLWMSFVGPNIEFYFKQPSYTHLIVSHATKLNLELSMTQQSIDTLVVLRTWSLYKNQNKNKMDKCCADENGPLGTNGSSLPKDVDIQKPNGETIFHKFSVFSNTSNTWKYVIQTTKTDADLQWCVYHEPSVSINIVIFGYKCKYIFFPGLWKHLPNSRHAKTDAKKSTIIMHTSCA